MNNSKSQQMECVSGIYFDDLFQSILCDAQTEILQSGVQVRVRCDVQALAARHWTLGQIVISGVFWAQQELGAVPVVVQIYRD